MTYQRYEAHLIYKGRATGVVQTVSVDFDGDDVNDGLTVLLAGMIRADAGGRWDLPDYVLEMHDGDPDTPPVVVSADEWPDD